MPMPIPVPFHVFPHGEGLDAPAYATEGSAGCDLRAAIEAELTITPGGRALVPTGVSVAIPPGYEGQVRMRSGLAHDKGLALLNAPGTVDSDYRGELRIIIANLGAEPVTLHRGDRIAQIVFSPVARATFERVEELPPSTRGAGGFGSTGKT
jgi:dUTP diphosphatase